QVWRADVRLRGVAVGVAVRRGRDRLAAVGSSFDLEVGALDLARLERLEDVTFLHVVEAVEEDAALEARLDLTDVVLEPLEARDGGLVDHGAVADDANARVPANEAVRDVAPGDRADARGTEECADLGLADRLLDAGGCEHPDEGLFDVIGELVDDAVGAKVDALSLGERAGLGVRPHVEADDDRVRSGGEHDVALGDRADARVDDVDPDLRVLDLRELPDDGLDRALHVRLDDDVQLLDSARLDLREELLQGDTLLRAAGELLRPQPLCAQTGEMTRLPVVLHHAGVLARRGRLVEAEDLDRRAGRGLLDPLAAEVVEGSHLSPGVAGDDRVADPERAALNEHLRDWSTSDVEPA